MDSTKVIGTGRLKDHLASAIEQMPLPPPICAFIGLMTTGIAIADSDDLCMTSDRKMEQALGVGYFPALPVDDTDIANDGIPAISGQGCFGWLHDDLIRLPCSLHHGGQFLPFLIRDRLQL